MHVPPFQKAGQEALRTGPARWRLAAVRVPPAQRTYASDG